MRLSWEHNLEAAIDEFARSVPGFAKPQLKSMSNEVIETQVAMNRRLTHVFTGLYSYPTFLNTHATHSYTRRV